MRFPLGQAARGPSKPWRGSRRVDRPGVARKVARSDPIPHGWAEEHPLPKPRAQVRFLPGALDRPTCGKAEPHRCPLPMRTSSWRRMLLVKGGVMGTHALGSRLHADAASRPHLSVHWAWLAGGLLLAFAVPFVFADVLEVNRDLFYGLYALAVGG